MKRKILILIPLLVLLSAAVYAATSAYLIGVSAVVSAPPAASLTQVGAAFNASAEDSYSLATGSRTLGSDNNSALVCVVGAYSYNQQLVTSVKWGSGQAYEKSFTRLGYAGGYYHVEVWYLTDWPSTLTSTVTVAPSDEYDIAVSCTEWTGVNQTTPLENLASTTDIMTTTLSRTVTSETGAKVVDVFACNNATATVGAGQTEQVNLRPGSTRVGSSIEDGAASVTMSWTLDDSDRYGTIAGFSINPL